jgi:alpha-mannosidase
MQTVYLVPHTHYDAVWVFTKEGYFYINIELILKQAVEAIEKSDYKFLVEQTATAGNRPVVTHYSQALP